MRLFTLFLVLPVLLMAQTSNDERATHLKGINYLYMNVDTSLASNITSTDRMDISDIVELQLRRADITLRPFVVNAPETNIPLVEVTIKPTQSRGIDNYEIILKVHDYVIIDRNKQRTTATIFEMRRDNIPATDDMDSLKSKLREIMGDFVAAFVKQNP